VIRTGPFSNGAWRAAAMDRCRRWAQPLWISEPSPSFRDWIRGMKVEENFIRDWKMEDSLAVAGANQTRGDPSRLAALDSGKRVAANVTGLPAKAEASGPI